MTDKLIQLAKAIGYPQEVPADAATFTFAVDDREIVARCDDGRLILSHTLLPAEVAASGEGAVTRLATFAAGRLLRETATLAWDGEAHAVILWSPVAANSDGDLCRAFESFCASVDWWSDRAAETTHGRAGASEMLIRP